MKNPDSTQLIEIDQKEKYNFPEIESFKDGLFEICEKMKGDIEANKWTKLLSDETGGRIPTLVIWNLIKHFHPDSAPKPFFLSSGLTYKPNTPADVFKELDFLKKITNPEDKCLLVTQFIRTGKTMKSMMHELDMVGIRKENIDIAAVVSDHNDEIISNKFGLSQGQLNLGTRNWGQGPDVEAFYPRFTGVIQNGKEYSSVPVKLTENVKQTGSRGKLIDHDEWMKIFDLKPGARYYESRENLSDEQKRAEYARRDAEPLSVEEEKELQDNINKAREDVNTLVREILRNVWDEA